ncbi:MAG: fibronectin type III domain-containing protein, partial [Candidatus Zixiibacteriota bacterium]
TSPILTQQSATSTLSASSLTALTTYYWRVRAQNSCGWGDWSTRRTFATSTGDITAPTIASATATSITDNSAGISWTTNETASTQVNYGTSTSYGSSTALVPTLVKAHEQTLSGLTPLTTYHYRVRSRDAAGNEAVSGDFVFSTAEVLTKIDNGIIPTVSSTYSGYSISEINDGVLDPFSGTASTWASTESATQAHWIEFNFGASQQVKRVVVYWAWNSSRSNWMTSQQMKLQSWNGSAYVDITTTNNTVADSCTFVDVTPVTTSRIRYYQPANMGPATYPSVAWLSEVDVYGTSAANAAPSVPVLTSPAAGSTVSSLAPVLVLNNSTDAQGDQITYNFQLSTSSSFATIVAQATGVVQGGAGVTSWTVSPNLSSGSTYFWRARSFDGLLYSIYSPYQSFTTATNGAPGAPTPQSPINGVRVSDMTPNLVVANAIDPNGDPLTYQFEVYNGAGTILRVQSPRVNSGATTTKWTVSITLAYKTNYTWRARTYDGQAYSVWSALQSFRTNRAPTLPQFEDELDPNVAQIAIGQLGNANSFDPDGDPITYEFEIFELGDATSLLKSISVPADSSTAIPAKLADLPANTEFSWRVRATDGEAKSEWTPLARFTTAAETTCGDEDISGKVDIRDASYLLNYIFSNGPSPQGAGGGDLNCDEETNISDAVLLIEFLYANGYEPCAKCGT